MGKQVENQAMKWLIFLAIIMLLRPYSAQEIYGHETYAWEPMLTNIREISSKAGPLNLDPSTCQESLKDTEGYWCDPAWSIRKANTKKAHERNVKRVSHGQPTSWEREITCPMAMRIGGFDGMGPGGKWLCDPLFVKGDFERMSGAPTPPPECLVYSLGSNNEWGFERAMLALFPHCQIHTMDFTSSPPPFVEPRIHFYKWGIAGTDNSSRNFYTLPSVVQKLEHMDKEIDVFKMDIEGYEFEALRAIFASEEGKKICKKMRIILMEVHFGFYGEKNSSEKWKEIMENLHNLGFALYYREDNYEVCSNMMPPCGEYAFIRLSNNFFLE
jgi:hypothetical protein